LIETDLSLTSGDVVMIGGLEDKQEGSSESRLPYFTWPFSKSSNSRETETILLLEVERI
jgi:hypothetical protein